MSNFKSGKENLNSHAGLAFIKTLLTKNSITKYFNKLKLEKIQNGKFTDSGILRK